MLKMQLDPTPRDPKDLKNQLTTEKYKEKHIVKRSRNGKIIEEKWVVNAPAALDIETSSWSENGKKKACLACWQFGINGKAYLGRTYYELIDFLEELKKLLKLGNNRILPVYVHNLSYEFQFLRNWLYPGDVFAADTREPYRAMCGGIELRDSYVLTGLSLEASADHCLTHYKIAKNHGWDYSKIRHSSTPLTDEEKLYAVTDVLVVMALIAEKASMEKGDSISDIPMTKTGYVRRDVRKACMRDPNFKQLIASLTIDPEEYEKLKLAYAGGFTHANHNFVGKINHNVGSYDFTSSYPATMVAEKFPMGIAFRGSPSSASEFKQWIKSYCCLIHCTFEGVEPARDQEHIISASKCIYKENAEEDNGRIITADKLEIWLTELDYKMIMKFYKIKGLKIHEMIMYYKAYLPSAIINKLLEYYEKKTMYKDKSGYEVEYALAKEMLNSIYGMMVQDIVRDDILYDITGTWQKGQGDPISQIDKYNKNPKRFTYYPWGVWITAYARYNLLCGIHACGENYLYSDTDSIKYLHDNDATFQGYVSRYNDLVKVKMETAMQNHGYATDRWTPKDIKGIPRPLGYWDAETDYDHFKTLGAKRYMGYYRHYKGEDRVYITTIAGSNKKKSSEFFASQKNPFRAFEDGTEIPAEFSGRMDAAYIDDMIIGDVVDYMGIVGHYEERSYINLSPTTYTLGYGKDFLRYLTSVWSGGKILMG